MPKFQMMSGNHVAVQGQERVMVEGKGAKKKTFITSPVNLDFKFPEGNRFRRTDGKISTGLYDSESPPRKPEAGSDGEVEEHDVTFSGDKAAARPKLPKNEARTSLVEEQDDETFDPEKGETPDDEGEGDESEELLAGPRDSKDVTKQFKKLSRKALVKVFHDENKNEYVITDEDDVTKPLPKAAHLKDADAVKDFLKNYTKGG